MNSQMMKLGFLEAAHDSETLINLGAGTISQGTPSFSEQCAGLFRGLIEARGLCRQLVWVLNIRARSANAQQPCVKGMLQAGEKGSGEWAGGEQRRVGAEHPDLAPGMISQALSWCVVSLLMGQRKVETWSVGSLRWL